MFKNVYFLVIITILQEVQHIYAVVPRSDKLPTELFKSVEAETEKPLFINTVPPITQQQQQQQQPQSQQIYNRNSFFNSNEDTAENRPNPFLPKTRGQTFHSTFNGFPTNEFSFDNDGNRVGTVFFQSSAPVTKTYRWYSSSGSLPDLEAQVKSELEKLQNQQFTSQVPVNGQYSGPGNGFYKYKSFQRTYSSDGGPAVTKHYEYDSRNGARTYFTYD